jgi:protease-4
MKEFFKYVFASAVGMLVFFIIIGIIGAMSIVGMISSSQATQTVTDNSVLVLNLSGEMNEQAGDNVFGQLTGNVYNNLGLEETLSAIKKAKENEKIKGIYIEAGAFSSDFASAQELRNTLLDFKKSGKWIIAYGDTYTQGTYYLASVANKVYLNPQGELDWHGLGSQPMFVKDLLAKFGVKMQVIKVGRYKSATEMFTEDKMSDSNREQTQVYINGLWGNMCKGVSESRKISVDTLNAYADRMIMFESQKQLLKYKLIDGLLYTDQVKAEIKKLLKIDKDETINQLSVDDMINVKEDDNGDQIAVYYAYGDIVDNPVTGTLLGGGHQIVAKDVCKDLEELMNDDDVKAVVVRVNSGGGSAYASEQIWHQITELKAKKPVVISMGGKAASGGYYMSCNANWIVAEPTTLTGSIGIFGMIPDRSQLLTQKLGIKFDEVKTNKNSTMGSSARPMNEEEIGYLQNYIIRGYSLFRQRVADGRKLQVNDVEKIAQGHVFLGQDAMKIKLVDQLGGLDVAVAKAAKLAKMKEYYTCSYPEQADWLSQLMSASSNSNYLDEQMRATMGEYYEPFMLLKQMNQLDAIQARIPFFLNIK